MMAGTSDRQIISNKAVSEFSLKMLIINCCSNRLRACLMSDEVEQQARLSSATEAEVVAVSQLAEGLSRAPAKYPSCDRHFIPPETFRSTR